MPRQQSKETQRTTSLANANKAHRKHTTKLRLERKSERSLLKENAIDSEGRYTMNSDISSSRFDIDLGCWPCCEPVGSSCRCYFWRHEHSGVQRTSDQLQSKQNLLHDRVLNFPHYGLKLKFVKKMG
eukprot:4576146-Amphidinium_carterae.2